MSLCKKRCGLPKSLHSKILNPTDCVCNGFRRELFQGLSWFTLPFGRNNMVQSLYLDPGWVAGQVDKHENIG